MRIGRFQADGESRIGRFEDDVVRDVSGEFDGFRDALTRPHDAEDADGRTFDRDEVTHLPPTTRENTVFCAALNYEAHAEESDIEVPVALIFTKLPRTPRRPPGTDLVSHPRDRGIDYEAELAAVIGEPARHVETDEALDYVAGYTLLNDTSARDLQLGLQVGDDDLIDWFSGKAMQRTTPVGPYVAVDEVTEDPRTSTSPPGSTVRRCRTTTPG